MKRTLFTLISGVACALPITMNAQGITDFGQFFNNNNGSFTDSQSALYNWSVTTSNAVATAPNNISAGNTTDSADLVPGEEARGRGFLFILPTPNDPASQPGASLMYTTHMGTSTVQQNNPQPDWFVDGPDFAFAGIPVEDVTSIRVRANAATADLAAHIGLQLDGSSWVFAAPAISLTTGWETHNIADLTSLTWVSGIFDGTTLDADPSDNGTVSLTGTESISGFAFYAITGTAGGNAARVRMDEMVVTAVPEPGTYALLLGLGAVLFVAYRRRR